MKRVLILGAGLVSRPHVRYLLDVPDFEVTVASRTVSKAQALVEGHPRGRALALDVDNEAALEALIQETDLAVSLLPYAYHPVVARLCVKHGKHMVTTSYVKDAMRALDGAAQAAGVILLNEIGVDPGIDHMSAMKVIHDVERRGGRVTSFDSWCGGLPAPEACDNPFGYKFSWSPIGVLLAGKNSAEYLLDGKKVLISADKLFESYELRTIEGLGTFEGYPNRNSVPYAKLYGVPEAKTMLRGTLRNLGWCETIRTLVRLGALDQVEKDWTGMTYAGLVRKLLGTRGKDLRKVISERLGLHPGLAIFRRLEWLGLFSEEPLPIRKGSALDILGARMIDKLSMAPGERDMIILQHEFVASYPGNRKEKIISTLVDYGIPSGDSSMARTVGLPAAIGTRMILEGRIQAKGVHIPVLPDIYKPILAELKNLGIAFMEKRLAL